MLVKGHFGHLRNQKRPLWREITSYSKLSLDKEKWELCHIALNTYFLKLYCGLCIFEFSNDCNKKVRTSFTYSVVILTSGGLPLAFWTTKNSFVTISITWPVWKTKSPFFLLRSLWNRQPVWSDVVLHVSGLASEDWGQKQIYFKN